MAGCPHCGDADSQVMDLLKAWKEIEELKALLNEGAEKAAERFIPVSPQIQAGWASDLIVEPAIDPRELVWAQRYTAIKEAYIKTRLEVSGSFGNWSGDTRRRVLENEISAELGFNI